MKILFCVEDADALTVTLENIKELKFNIHIPSFISSLNNFVRLLNVLPWALKKKSNFKTRETTRKPQDSIISMSWIFKA